ncbi:hypothetical protein PAXRUDRAFT_156332, partial [Paxillus rubicundulus Ve08.2h10]
KNVPHFNSMKFAVWRPTMDTYLQMIGAWCLTNGTAAFPTDITDRATCRLLDDRACGSISLLLGINFNHFVLEELMIAGPPQVVLGGARQTWDGLNAHFRAIFTAGVFSKLFISCKFKIHERDNILASIGEPDGLFNCITAPNLAENLHAMMMLSALLDLWDQLASNLLGTIALADLTLANIIPRIHKESAHCKEHGSSSHPLKIIECNMSSDDICCKGHSMQNSWYKPGENQPSGSGNQNQQARPSNCFQGTHRTTCGRGHGCGNNSCTNAVYTGIANTHNVDYNKYAKEDFFTHIEDYNDETASNKAEITFLSLNPPAEEARDFFLKGIHNGTICPNGF